MEKSPRIESPPRGKVSPGRVSSYAIFESKRCPDVGFGCGLHRGFRSLDLVLDLKGDFTYMTLDIYLTSNLIFTINRSDPLNSDHSPWRRLQGRGTSSWRTLPG